MSRFRCSRHPRKLINNENFPNYGICSHSRRGGGGGEVLHPIQVWEQGVSKGEGVCPVLHQGQKWLHASMQTVQSEGVLLTYINSIACKILEMSNGGL